MQSLTAAIDAIDDVEVFGRVKTVQGLLIEIVGPVRELRVGGRVEIETTAGGHARRPRSSGSVTAMRSACRSGR